MSLSVFSQVPTRLRNDVIAIKGGDTLYFFVLDAYGNASIYGSQPLTIKNTDTLYFDDGSYMITAASADDTLWLPGQSGTASVRMSSDTATGNYAVAMGNNTTASGYASTAMGNTTIASGPYSTAMGNGTTASGAGSFAHGGGFLGLFTTASGDYSAAWGAQTTASGERSTAWGGQTTASGSYSTAMGNGTTASGVVSFATGVQTKALSLNETTFGRYNDTLNSTDASSWVATDNLFVVGNGADDANRNNAFAILKNGNATFDANVTVGDTLFLNSDTILGATDTTSLSNRIDQRWSLLGNAGTDTTTNFIGTTDNLGLYFRTNNTNKMLLNRDGKLGIGITPLANLHIAEAATGTHKENSFILGNVTNNWPAFGAVGIPGNSAFIFSRAGESNSAGYRIFQIGGNGTITMYYPNATQRLFISFDALANTQKFYGNLAVTLGMERHTTAATAGNNLTINAGGAVSGGTNLSGGNLKLTSGTATGSGTSNIGFYTATAGASGTADATPTEKVTILGSGNVGINNTNPASLLTIKATGHAGGTTPFLVEDDLGTDLVTIGDTGRLSILNYGKTSTLINDNFGLYIDANNFRVKDRIYFDTIANFNTFIGYLAGENNVGNYATEGIRNTAVGMHALKANIIGISNTAIGYECMLNNISDQNTAVGMHALKAETTGTQNVAIGTNCMEEANSGASQNIAIGVQALYVNQASANVAVGHLAAYSNTTGSGNVAMGGAGVLYDNTTGSFNTGVGYGALRFFNGVDGATAYGAYSLYNNVTGANNTSIGMYSGYNTTGANNTYLGYRSGFTNTGENNIHIGAFAGEGEIGSNKLIIHADDSYTAVDTFHYAISGIMSSADSNNRIIINGDPDNALSNFNINGTFRYVLRNFSVAGDTISIAAADLAADMRYVNDSAYYAVSVIAAGNDGDIIEITGTSDTNFIDFVDSATLKLAGDVTFRVGLDDVISFAYRNGVWIERYRSDN